MYDSYRCNFNLFPCFLLLLLITLFGCRRTSWSANPFIGYRIDTEDSVLVIAMNGSQIDDAKGDEIISGFGTTGTLLSSSVARYMFYSNETNLDFNLSIDRLLEIAPDLNFKYLLVGSYGNRSENLGVGLDFLSDEDLIRRPSEGKRWVEYRFDLYDTRSKDIALTVMTRRETKPIPLDNKGKTLLHLTREENLRNITFRTALSKLKSTLKLTN